jgi:hypothetical protein
VQSIVPLGNSASTSPFPPLEGGGEEALDVAAALDDVEEATVVLLGVGIRVGVGVEEEDVVGFSTNTAALTELEVGTGTGVGDVETTEVEGAGGAGAGEALWRVPPTMTYLPDLIPS